MRSSGAHGCGASTSRSAMRCAEREVLARYQQLKLQLAAAHADDKSAYTAAKAPFIQSVLASLADAGERD